MTFDELLTLVSSNNAPALCTNSHLAEAGGIFVALEGAVCDGNDFIDEALGRGAKYIVSQKPCRCPRACLRQADAGADVIVVEDSAEAAAALAQASRGNPASRLTNLAVTGTNGKTTVAFFVRSCIQAAGHKCGLIGTVIYDTGLQTSRATLTTPDCLTIAWQQSQMVKAGAKYMVVEASSHALSQNRLAHIAFKAAAFTNLTGDHLDYHKTQKEYLAAKAKLFEQLSLEAVAVLNKQSPQAQEIAGATKAKILWYAVDEQADITAHVESLDVNGTVFILEYAGERRTVKISLLGWHNVSNSLAAAGLCLAVGFDLQTITAGLSALRGVPGRLEKVSCTGHERRVKPAPSRVEGSHVFVDYAHTDDALKNVLTALRPFCAGSLIVVFGCGGDRDKTKRPRMAKVAEELADFIIVTSDNPRTEKPQDIINEIVAGLENPSSPRITVEQDREKAIELAIGRAAKGDIVLIAGKGHENYQIIGTQRFDFDDKEVALEFLRKQK
jgi:UDP-N-acetylmuramoyl-L-alanyl-D-glutamate--2,6-diaminopimelate ligase